MNSAANPFAAFEGQKYLSLETFRKNGVGVRTPIWFAAETTGGAAAVLYIYTIGETGKVKRIRNNPRVRIAPCDMRGNVTGEFVEARAEILSGGVALRATRLLNRKYFPLKQILGFFALFSRRERVVMALRPA
jgi:PPOX class probable F420-dependent enzyme